MIKNDDDPIELDTDFEEPIQFNQKQGLERIEQLVKEAYSSLEEAKRIANKGDHYFSFTLGEIDAQYSPNSKTWEDQNADHWTSSSQSC